MANDNSLSGNGCRSAMFGRRVVLIVVIVTLTGTAPVDAAPTGGSTLVQSESSGQAWVAVGGGLEPGVTPVNLDTEEVGQRVPVDDPMESIVASPDGRTIYAVTSEGIVPIDSQSQQRGALLAIHGASDMVVNPDGTSAYVAKFDFNEVVPLDLETDEIGSPIPLAGSPGDLVYEPDGSTVWVAVEQSENLVPISTATQTRGIPISLGLPPRQLAIAPDGSRVYATNRLGGSGPADPVLLPIDIENRVAEPFIELPDNSSGRDVEVTPDGLTAYVTDGVEDQLTPVDLATRTAGTPVPCGDSPLGLAITPDGATAYVASSGSGELIPVDLASNRTHPGIPSGFGTFDVSLVIPPTPPAPPATPVPETPTFTG